MKRLKIAVLFGGCSPEYSVSLQSAAAVLQNMDSSKDWGANFAYDTFVSTEAPFKDFLKE